MTMVNSGSKSILYNSVILFLYHGPLVLYVQLGRPHFLLIGSQEFFSEFRGGS